MKLMLKTCLIALLFSSSSYGQRDRVFKSLEEAMSVHKDSVYRLDLSRERLTEVPTEILKFRYLQELDLSKNNLTSLPKDFYFADLRMLDLSKNKFEQFPATLCQHKTIRNLFMGKNYIKHLPECIGEMRDLIVFDIWFNPLEDIPESMTKLRNLRSLDLSGISFTKDEQEKWSKMLHWVKIEFEAACNCNN